MEVVKRYDIEADTPYACVHHYDRADGDWVKFEDYAALKAERDALAAENARMRIAINRTIGWQESVDTENAESVRPLHELDTPATDAYANQLRAEGVEMFAKHFNCADISDDILEFAANLRKENGDD